MDDDAKKRAGFLVRRLRNMPGQATTDAAADLLEDLLLEVDTWDAWAREAVADPNVTTPDIRTPEQLRHAIGIAAATLDQEAKQARAEQDEQVRRIVALIRTECERYTAEAKSLSAKVEENSRQSRKTNEARDDLNAWMRVSSQASMARTLAAYVERGDYNSAVARGEV